MLGRPFSFHVKAIGGSVGYYGRPQVTSMAVNLFYLGNISLKTTEPDKTKISTCTQRLVNLIIQTYICLYG